MRRPTTPPIQRLAIVLLTLALCAVSMIVAGPRGSYDTLISVFLGITGVAVIFWLVGLNWILILARGRSRFPMIMTCVAGVACALMSGLAAPALAMKWRGEREAVTVVSKAGVATRLRSDAITEYSYQLKTSTGQLVRPDLLDSDGRFRVGQRLWVTADPWGLNEPVLDDEVSELPLELVGVAVGIAALLAGGFVLIRVASASAPPDPAARS